MEGGVFMEDIFTGDIFEKIEPPHGVSFKIVGTALPTNQDIYFVAKWHEIFERYTTARLFVRKALEDNWEYWFNRVDDEKVQHAIENKFKAELYETALLSYNILVDLTWAWTYVSAEYLLYTFDEEGNVTNAKDVCGMHPIEEAYELLRKTENGVSTPHAEGNPFHYLKVMRPEFSDAVDTIVEFWKVFSNSPIRNLYNFVKHKGKPLYEEVEKPRGGKVMSILIGNEEYPSDIRDVQKMISVEEGLKELIDFDNNLLFPYVEKLLSQLKVAVDPSPMAFL
jgi:hypothetical protein